MASSTEYQFVAATGEVGAFRRGEEEQTLQFFRSQPRRHWHGSLDKWEKVKEHYANSVSQSPEIIRAACYLLQLDSVQGIREELIVEASMPWGTYYPRIWRGRYNPVNPLMAYTPFNPQSVYGHAFLQSMVATASLYDSLADLFRYIEPSQQNASAHGHRIRELLILACTEIEAAWRGILQSNTPQHSWPQRGYSTRDYVHLHAPLRLADWKVELVDYANFGTLSPFASWDAAKPTQSLSWYDSYNAVKHDRENQFSRATLGSLLDAMAAVYVMQCAMWGPDIYDRWHGNRPSPFYLRSAPSWEAGKLYIPNPHPPREPSKWASVLLYP